MIGSHTQVENGGGNHHAGRPAIGGGIETRSSKFETRGLSSFVPRTLCQLPQPQENQENGCQPRRHMRVKREAVRPRHAGDGKKYPKPRREINEIHAWLCEAKLRVWLEEIYDQGGHGGQSEKRMKK